MVIKALTGVYHADGGVIGKLRYGYEAYLKGRSCSLCDITHAFAWEKRSMAAFRRSLGIPFELLHLNEQSAALAAVTRGHTPCIAARTTDSYRIFVTDEELRRCGGDVAALMSLLADRLAKVT